MSEEHEQEIEGQEDPSKKEHSEDRKQYIDELYKTLHYSNEQFDKNVLYIASGAFGLSFAFIEKLVKLECATDKDFLTFAWFAFSGVVFISLLSHFFSSLALRLFIINYDTPNEEKVRKKYNLITRCLNIIMILGLLLGTILLIIFIKRNI